jgi:CRP-like cAMP-binding protein
MAKDPKLELLHSIPLFSRLNRRALTRLGQLTDQIDVRAGRVLMRQGESGSEMFIVVSGRLTVERDGRMLSERRAGDFVGEIALLAKGPRTATVTAAEPSTLLVIERQSFHTLMEEQPDIRLAIVDELVRRLRTLEVDAAH